jgi:DNA polymerase III subunit gamma/tau
VVDPGDGASEPYQFLYRRFRPRRFDEVLGQQHVSQGLRTAVREHRVGHAYLFSGPRGTGKTSTARILAMALNCEDPQDGEPDGVCDSCVEIAQGSSLDVHELDAASNNGVDAMRDLVARAALGTPGRWKVYIVDEVHMLSTAASNALLKTLEEPPSHVVFVLATTDPQKVLPTVRSRTQHYEFRLIDPDTLVDLLGRVASEAGIQLPDGAVDAAVRRGRGSARDALSALDQMAAGGVVDDEAPVVVELAQALAERDVRRAMVGVAVGLTAGLDPMRIAADLVEHLRQGFLGAVAPELVTVVGAERDQVAGCASRLGLPALVRAMETLGRAQVDMRDSPDTRVDLEVALIRLSHPESDTDVAALTERVERLERALASGAVPPAPSTPRAEVSPGGTSARSADAPPGPPADESPGLAPSGSGSEPGPGPGLARQALGAVRGRGEATPRSRGASSATAPSSRSTAAATPSTRSPEVFATAEASPAVGTTDHRPTAAGTTDPDRERGSIAVAFPTRDDLVEAWGDRILQALPDRARARFRAGRWTRVAGERATFALPNDQHRSYCEVARADVETKLREHFGVPIGIDLVVDDDTEGRADPLLDADPAPKPSRGSSPNPGVRPSPGASTSPSPEPDLLDPEVLAAETEPAGDALSAAERLKQIFPGAEEV